MKLSNLVKTYQNFERPTFTIMIEQKLWYPNEDFSVTSFDIQVSASLKANMATICIEHIKERRLVDKLMNGNNINIKMGYQKQEIIVFAGYIHELRFQERDEQLHQVEIEAMDVKGLMMLHKQNSFACNKKRNVILRDLLTSSLYQSFVANVVISNIPACMNHPVLIDSQSDYDILCAIAKAVGFTCFVKQETLYFKKAYETSNRFVIDTWEGIDHIEQITNMDEAYGQLEVISTMGLESMQSVHAKLSFSDKPQSRGMKKILNSTMLTHVNEEFTTMEEVKVMSAFLEEEITYGYASMEGNGVLLPDIHCGDQMTIEICTDGLDKQLYIYEVHHHMKTERYSTTWKGKLKKG